VDYHRFHFSLPGKVSDNRLINGSLFSVNPIALRKRISIFWENKRYLSIVENEQVGKVVQLLIGATCVGSVHITANENSFVEKGDEFGYFSFGGSCVMTIFPKNRINFREELLEQSAKGYETYFRFGEAMGHIA
jgi:phosphatidylserine decarboxylase